MVSGFTRRCSRLRDCRRGGEPPLRKKPPPPRTWRNRPPHHLGSQKGSRFGPFWRRRGAPEPNPGGQDRRPLEWPPAQCSCGKTGSPLNSFARRTTPRPIWPADTNIEIGERRTCRGSIHPRFAAGAAQKHEMTRGVSDNRPPFASLRRKERSVIAISSSRTASFHSVDTVPATKPRVQKPKATRRG